MYKKARNSYAVRFQQSCILKYNIYQLYIYLGGIYEKSNGLLELNKRVYVPKYYWKVVCEPTGGGSIAFYGINPDGWDGVNNSQRGCLGKQMHLDNGLVYCVSFDSLKSNKISKDWNLPSLAKNCNPSIRGTFLDQSLGTWY